MDGSMLQNTIMGLIMYGGDAKCNAIEAITAAKQGDFELAHQKLAEAEKSLLKAHHSQTELLTNEAQGEKAEFSLLLVHSQDHLMTSITFNDLAKEFVYLYESLAQKD